MSSTPSIVTSPRQRHLSASSSMQNQDDLFPHLISLKVIRLSRPQLAATLPVYYESGDNNNVLVEGLETLNISDLTASLPIEGKSDGLQIRDFGLSQMLQLPTEFGTIYLGESLNANVIINNESSSNIQQIGLKVELQTSSQRFILFDTTTEPQATLATNSNYDTIVSHEIKELGVHILVCYAQYSMPDGKKRQLRKFYKFQVSNPLAVKTKLNNLVDGRIFLEAQIQNVSEGPMFLERMNFEPSEHFDFEDFNYRTLKNMGTEEKQIIFGNNYIQPKDTRQYLYMLSPKDAENDRLSRTTNSLGKLDIVWRSHMGDLGRLQTSQLTRKPPVLDDIEVYPFWLSDKPVEVVLESPFKLGVRIKNYSNENMKLVLSAVKSKMITVLLSGLNNWQLGEVGPNKSVEVHIELFPLISGLQRIGGLKVMDLISGYSKDIDHICDVFVLSNPNNTLDDSL